MDPAILSAPVLIACCGNPEAGDDALGALVARALLEGPALEGAEVVDLGTRPMALVDHLGGRRALMVVDAVRQEAGPPGRLVDLEWRTLRGRGALALASRAASTHGQGFAEALALADALDLLPADVRILGLTIGQAEVGEAIDARVRSTLPLLLRRLRRRLSVAARRALGAGNRP
jgi:hydrogenase maturation protease